ncbi:hypothetical protein BCV71DRAFT_230074 [Rhizopus microsporus]|uniref:Uncharacterized protein n=1 Tax=Rhizopus microsporus TaxID=58291 RepID=A0A1X0RLY3_RHIZD|nr:hypothetical protein BCV71DRAFT_230074 [Rhizopus microsporus]
MCSDNSHLWGIEDRFRHNYSRLYAEITFSAEFTKKKSVMKTLNSPLSLIVLLVIDHYQLILKS